MKTTEFFVDQIVIGMALLLISGLFVPGTWVTENVLKADFGKAIALAAIAYLLGIVYDRYADTLLGDLEKHHRVCWALRKRDKALQDRGRNPESEAPKRDPFPEDRYRAALLLNDNASDYAPYLRSRIRLTRALTTLVPALSVALLVMLFEKEKVAGTVRVWGIALLVGAYAAVFINKLMKPCRLGLLNPPKTDELKDETRYRTYRREIYDPTSKGDGFALAWREERLFWVLILFGAGGAGLALRHQGSWLALVPLAGIALTLFCGWCWWRISETFFHFLATTGRRARRSKAATTP